MLAWVLSRLVGIAGKRGENPLAKTLLFYGWPMVNKKGRNPSTPTNHRGLPVEAPSGGR